jgi:hypothetical protein
MTEETFEQFRVSRAIRPDVWRSQFERYTTGDRARSLYPQHELARNQRAELTKMVKWMDRVGGIIIHRTPIPGASPITPELRPEKPMLGRKTTHYHGDDQTPETLARLNKPGRPEEVLHPIQILAPHKARFHIDGKKHGGENADDVHEHVKEKKYTFLAAPVEHYWSHHTHRWLFERHPDRLEQHLAKRHPGEGAPGLDEDHAHRYSRKGRGDAARIDLPALARALLDDAVEFFLVLEGSIKGASVLSEILDTGRKASVASVPSVTLWLAGPDRDEVEICVRRYRLQGKRVYIVIDADGSGNSNVRAQALFVRDHLRKLGVKAWIVAPPYDPNDLDEDGKPRLNGVDDFRREGGTLDGLHVFRREARPVEEIVGWLGAQGHPPDLSILRTASKIQALSLFPPSNPLKTTARILGMEKKRQAAAEIDALERLGVIRLLGGSTNLGRFYNGRPIPEEWADEDGWRRALHGRAILEWVDRPRYEFAAGLEAIEREAIPLRELSDTIPYEGKPLERPALVKMGPVDEILEAAANRSGTSVREGLRALGRSPAALLGRHWAGSGDPTKRDVRDLLVLYLLVMKRLELVEIAAFFDLSDKQVGRILDLPAIRAGRALAPGSVYNRWRKRVGPLGGSANGPGHDPV